MTMMPRRVLALLVPAFLAGVNAYAQSAPALPGDLETVATGGFWKTSHKSGQYRVVIMRSGYEEIESQVYLQWLYDRGSETDTTEIVASVPVKALNDSVFHYGHVRFHHRNGGTTIVLDGVNIDTPSRHHFEWLIVARAPGVYSVRGTGLHPDAASE